MTDPRERYDMSVFVPDDGETAGVPFSDFTTALGVWSFMRRDGLPTVRAAADAFNVTDDVIRKAADTHPWLFLSGPFDDPTKQLIEPDGE